MAHHELDLFADYHQIHIADVGHRKDDGVTWTDDSVRSRIALGPYFIAFGTARNMNVPIALDVETDRPDPELDRWDQVTECILECPSGEILIKGPSEYEPESFRTKVPSSRMIVRIMWGGLDTISEDGLSGQDHYAIQMWPGEPQGLDYLKKHDAT